MNNIKFYEDVSQSILTKDVFLEDYKNLISNSYKKNFDNIRYDTYKRLIESASIFSCSNDESHKKMAFKIATAVIENEKLNDVLKASSELIFLRLGNFPTLKLSIRDNRSDDYFNIFKNNGNKEITPSINTEISKKVSSNEIKIGQEFELMTDFQSKVFKLLMEKQNISISAPTSAGKSYVLYRYVSYCILNNDKFLTVYIVPTRALISQVQLEFRKILNEFNIDNVRIMTSSWDVLNSEEIDLTKTILILTQERLQNIEGRIDEFEVDLLIVDEAQKIEEGSRGIILEESIQQIIDWNPNLQIVFISPFSDNPEKLGKIFSFENLNPVKTNESPVNQNLMFVNVKNKQIDILQGSQELKKKIKITQHHLLEKIPETYRRKAFIASNFIEKGSTMIYCNRPVDCRKTAKIIAENRENNILSDLTKESIKFLKSNIHPDYFLIDYLKENVGYHYANMIPSVKTIIESLFSNRDIDIICCTSTLLEGVNFPAKNIVIYKPKRGMAKPMDKLSFWNLAGRAGRLMKDFSGNVYCIDIDKWGDSYKPSLELSKHTIQSSFEDALTKNKEKIIDHLSEYTKLRDNEVTEAAVTRFLINEIRQGNDEFILQLLKRNTNIEKPDLIKIDKYVKDIISNIKLNGTIILKNRSIDPRLQNNLYLELINRDDPPIPVHPLQNDFYEKLIEILNITHKHFLKLSYVGSFPFISWLATRWTNEIPLNRIIVERINFLEEKSNGISKQDINKEIEGIIKCINNELRYEITRDISCYIDILQYVLYQKGRDPEIIDENLPYYIEIGACKPTTLTLINNGIPRTAAISISSFMPNNIQDFQICIEHIHKNEEEIKNKISSILFNELAL